MSKEAPWIALAIDWQDSEMLDDTSEAERLAWLCLLCHAKANGRAGKVRLRVEKFAQNYRLSANAVISVKTRALAAGAITVDGDTVEIINWRHYQDPRARTAAQENIAQKKRKPVKQKQVAANALHFIKNNENSATTHPSPPTPHKGKDSARSINTESTNKTTEVITHNGRKRPFVRPTLAEVEEYCGKRGKGVDPQKWFDHYTANGWRVGRNAMRDWKAAVRTWENSEYGSQRSARDVGDEWERKQLEKQEKKNG